jgi:hypothetical protein
MKKDKLYRTLKNFIKNTKDYMGLPKKPTISVLSEVEEVIFKYEQEILNNKRIEADISNMKY